MKKIIFFIFSLLICVIPYRTYAFCTNSTLQEYRGYARDVKIKYSLVNDDGDGGNYKITFNNMNYKIYAKDKESNITFKRTDEDNDNEIVTSDTLFQGGTTRVIEYYTIDSFCPNDIIHTINLNIPKHNIYYNTDTCKGITNYEYCEKYVFTKLSNQEIKRKIDEYRRSHEIDVVEDDDSFKLTLPMIIGGSVFLVAIIILIIFLNKYRQKKREEEW